MTDHQTMAASSRDLAAALLPSLEAVSNIHYLIDICVEDAGQVRELRELEDKICHEMIALVRKHL